MVGAKLGAALARLQTIKEEVRFTREQLIILGVLAVLAVAGGVLAARQSQIEPVTAGSPGKINKAPATLTKKARPPEPSEKKAAPIFVHVAGDVVNPGVYQVKAGSRVADAVSAAGGPINSTVLDHLNLAAKIVDGQKVMVKKGVVPTVDGVGAAPVLVNINTGTATDLERLDGVGPVLAQRILAWRIEHEGFSSVSQLKQVSGIGPKKFAQLKEQVSLN